MKVKNCSEIKDLEKRLLCLQEKYDELTEQLGLERNNIISDQIGNYHSILVEREFVEKQIITTQRRIKNLGKLYKLKKSPDEVNIGSCVKLKNHKYNLDVCLVEEHSSQPQKGFISIVSPIGRAIFGKHLGDQISVSSPAGKVEYTIMEIT
jgi:transcription elongation factor GreA